MEIFSKEYQEMLGDQLNQIQDSLGLNIYKETIPMKEKNFDMNPIIDLMEEAITGLKALQVDDDTTINEDVVMWLRGNGWGKDFLNQQQELIKDTVRATIEMLDAKDDV